MKRWTDRLLVGLFWRCRLCSPFAPVSLLSAMDVFAEKLGGDQGAEGVRP